MTIYLTDKGIEPLALYTGCKSVETCSRKINFDSVSKSNSQSKMKIKKKLFLSFVKISNTKIKSNAVVNPAYYSQSYFGVLCVSLVS